MIFRVEVFQKYACEVPDGFFTKTQVGSTKIFTLEVSAETAQDAFDRVVAWTKEKQLENCGIGYIQRVDNKVIKIDE